jgi:hypothetical protein
MVALTDYYGCPAVDTVLTATQGTDKPEKIFVNILGCTVPNWLSTMPSDMVEGGFSSRTLYIVQSEPREANPRPIITPQLAQLYHNLIIDLQTISLISGEYTLTEGAEITYDTWYRIAYTRIDEHDPRLKAYFARKGEHVLKVAMCVGASESNSLIIDEHHINVALRLLKQIEDVMPIAFRGVSFSDSTKHMDRITYQIKEGGGKIEKSRLLRLNRFYMDHLELDSVLKTLEESALIRVELNTRTGKWWYYLLEDVV